jgi:hypothetical protein
MSNGAFSPEAFGLGPSTRPSDESYARDMDASGKIAARGGTVRKETDDLQRWLMDTLMPLPFSP